MKNALMEQVIARKYALLLPSFNERTRREWAGSEALALGRGGLACVSRVTGLAPNTVRRGMRELEAREDGRNALPPDRIRHEGGGRKPVTAHDPFLLPALRSLVDPATRGDPESPLLWTSKSAAKLAAALCKQGHDVSAQTIRLLLRSLGYSMQANRKTSEGKKSHPDRDAQFQHIADSAKDFLNRGQPVVSVDAKKRELIGNFKNGGREWERKKQPVLVKMHDFPDVELGKATPYGLYDFKRNEGWVNVGISGNTAQFAVESIRRWWQHMGKERYPDATELLITADSGGSNGSRSRLWKVELQQFADETGLTLLVLHFPPGTSKWNKIEHRLFCYITKNWRGRPLISAGMIVQLIGSVRTETGLTVRAMLDENTYLTGIVITDEEMAELHLEPEAFHGEWNYRIRPRG